MSMFDRLPMRATIQSLSTTTDAGGGVQNVYTTVQSGVRCSINTTSGSARDEFGQDARVTSATVAFLSDDLTSQIQRGWQVINDHTGTVYIVRGISAGEAYGNIKKFTYLTCEQKL